VSPRAGIDKLVCVGKNYAEHARELGDAIPGMPVLFLKPPSVLVQARRPGATLTVPLPAGRGAVHHECEIAVRLARGGRRLTVAAARRAIDAVTLGLDMTLRDVQARLKSAGHPWEASKVFAGSAVLGPWFAGREIAGLLDAEFVFLLDGRPRQTGHASRMTLSPGECVAYASEVFDLCPGDVVLTGTPAGVGPVEPGQVGEMVWGDRVVARVAWVAADAAPAPARPPDQGSRRTSSRASPIIRSRGTPRRSSSRPP
jgi:2-keto-4-pentenoate hydratase/2-oxohepta-3-ene-1,7-dioic acid hydratase in catechol pathway